MLIESGKRLHNLIEYASLLLPMEHANDDAYVNQCGAFTDPKHDRIYPIETSPGHFRFMSGPEFSPRIYRGQTQFYEQCRPSLYRRDAIEGMFWATKTIELGEVIWEHPGIADLLRLVLEGLRFDFSLEALAQHYEYPTGFLDFSRSRDVAMFFATCARDRETGAYAPLKSGGAVLYTVDLRALIMDPNRKAVLPLGFEPLPRPEAQLALAVWLDLHENLNGMSWVRYEEFEVSPKMSGRYFDMFDGGKTLFPENPLDTHIEALRGRRSISLSALKLALDIGVLPLHPHGIDGVVREFGAKDYDVREDTPAIPQEVMSDLRTDWLRRSSEYFGRIGMRGVGDHFQR